MRLVTYNIQFGRGRDGHFDLDRIAAEVRSADVIALQEVERFWSRSGGDDQPAELAARLPEYHWVYGPGVDLHQGGPGPASGVERRQFGNMLLSRTPIETCRVHLLPNRASIGPMSVQRCAVEGVITHGALRLRVCSVHLDHLSAPTRLPQVERLLEIHRTAGAEGAPLTAGAAGKAEWTADGLPGPMPRAAILAGDFNFEPASEEYLRMVGPESTYGGRITNPEGFVDAWDHTGNDVRAGHTSDVRGRPARLDYCFVSAALAPRIRACTVDVDARGSDHLPAWLELDSEPD